LSETYRLYLHPRELRDEVDEEQRSNETKDEEREKRRERQIDEEEKKRKESPSRFRLSLQDSGFHRNIKYLLYNV